ncbi:MAG: 30S ribosomal protein S20 [Candidatus Pacebacteria bacterium]|nr:30S ribosomal protein S20 [Candidatus Paceibacterota bacterium]
MPIIKSAKKALRGSERKRVFNLRRKRNMRDTINVVNKLILDKKKDDANKGLALAYKAIDKATKDGIIKKNTAARKKSLLSRSIKNIA